MEKLKLMMQEQFNQSLQGEKNKLEQKKRDQNILEAEALEREKEEAVKRFVLFVLFDDFHGVHDNSLVSKGLNEDPSPPLPLRPPPGPSPGTGLVPARDQGTERDRKHARDQGKGKGQDQGQGKGESQGQGQGGENPARSQDSGEAAGIGPDLDLGLGQGARKEGTGLFFCFFTQLKNLLSI